MEKIEKAVASLPLVELTEFAAWFEAFRADLWDREIERDIDAGKLADAAITDHRADDRTNS